MVSDMYVTYMKNLTQVSYVTNIIMTFDIGFNLDV